VRTFQEVSRVQSDIYINEKGGRSFGTFRTNFALFTIRSFRGSMEMNGRKKPEDWG